MDAIGTTRNGEASDHDTLLLFGGAACLLLGAGLILSSSLTRRYLGESNAGSCSGGGAGRPAIPQAAGHVSRPVRYRIDPQGQPVHRAGLRRRPAVGVGHNPTFAVRVTSAARWSSTPRRPRVAPCA